MSYNHFYSPKNIGIKYRELNETFKPKLVFHLGAEAGFFSEYNNMIFAMLYCLQNQIQFTLYSKDANFAFENGWTDFFLPFCAEEVNHYHSKFNKRRPFTYKRQNGNRLISLIYNHWLGPIVKHKNKIRDQIEKHRHFKNLGTFYFTHELWDSFHSGNMGLEEFCLPELSIAGNVREASQKLMDLTWQYNIEVKQEIEYIISKLNLPLTYIGLHIRGGDKITEFELHSVNTYIEKAESIGDCRNAFVLTDDYRIIEELYQSYPLWNFFTLCDKDVRGYYHSKFIRKDKFFKRKQIIHLLASTDILRKAMSFVGTYNSNVGTYIGIRMDHEKCFGVDFENWKIF